jgi:hypothetical protein
MNRVLRGLTITLLFTLVRIPSFAQAVAESVLLGAGSSTATVKAGSALNSAMNRGSKQLAGRVQRQMLQPANPAQKSHLGAVTISRYPVKATAAPTHGTVISSIQGGVTSCALASQTASAAGSTTEPSPTNCSGQPASEAAPQKYKSVITLSFPK